MTGPVGADLTDMIAGGEGATIEFKRSLTKDLGRESCAFANAGGRTVLVGVNDAGKSVVVADHNRLKSRVRSTARSADLAIDVEIGSVGEILRVVVPPQKRKPHSFGGRFFMRDGASSRQVSNAEVEELFYATGRLHFDRKPCPDFSIENDLDEETWGRFSSRAKIPEAMDRMVALRNLGLLEGVDRMTHAGAWLLARDIRRFTTSACVSCALFMGTEKVRILDRRDFNGDVPTMIDDVVALVAWILTKLNVEFIIRRVRREDRPELPEETVREVVANAAAHRDGRSTANVQVYVVKEQMERQSGWVAGRHDGAGPRHEEHAPEFPAVRHAVTDGCGREDRFRHQSRSRSLLCLRRCRAGDRRLRAPVDGDVSETGGDGWRAKRARCVVVNPGCPSRNPRVHEEGPGRRSRGRSRPRSMARHVTE